MKKIKHVYSNNNNINKKKNKKRRAGVTVYSNVLRIIILAPNQ